MVICWTFGIFLLAFGIIVTIKPATFDTLNRVGNKVLFTDATLFAQRKFSGLLFMILGVSAVIQGGFTHDALESLQNWNPLPGLLLLSGVAGIFMGILFFMNPLLLVRVSSSTNRPLSSYSDTPVHPRRWGMFFVLTGLVILVLPRLL